MDAPVLAPAAAVTLEAPAKINLSLHVVGRRADGYHLLDGLVVFARVCDRLSVAAADTDSLDIVGPLARGVPIEDNIVLKALALARRVGACDGISIGPLALTLKKNLPAAAGIGGGSADAAALLRHLGQVHPPLRRALAEAAVQLGADVPMCLAGRAARIAGVGERLFPLPAMPALHMVLVNPRVAISTPAVFSRLRSDSHRPSMAVPESGFASRREALAFLRECRNDLGAPAEALQPIVGEVASRLRADGASLVRMSGSGATVFAVHESAADAAEAAAAIRAERPDWWVVSTRSHGSNDEDGEA